MSKLNIIEAMKMPIGTEFTVVNSKNDINVSKVILDIDYDNKFLRWGSGEKLLMISDNIFATFTPIQQPVSFMEDVINSDKECKVIHKLLDTCFFEDFNTFDSLISELSNAFNSRDLRQIIKEGQWYLEESEELDNERLSQQH